MGDNTYLEGAFAPVHAERTITDLAVRGRLPEALEGRFVRIGPNPVQPPADPARHHWFLGDGMAHGVRLRAGSAEWYRNRWVRSPAVAAALGEDPPAGPTPPLADMANTALVPLAGRTLALTETAFPYELGYELDTIGRTDLGGPMPNGFTAHPKVDPASGDLHGFGYGPAPPHLVYVHVSAEGRVVATEPIDVGGPGMVHDFAITDGHLVFFDLPVQLSAESLAEGYGLPYRWDPAYPARVGLLRRGEPGAATRWFEVEPCYVFHVLNAFDVVGEGGEPEAVVVDVVRYDHVFRDDLLGPSDSLQTLDRWTLDLAAGTLGADRLDDRPQEFPRADPRRTGRPHRFGYACQVDPAEHFATMRQVLKHDLEAGTTEVHEHAAGRVGSEAVFVPSPEGSAEDEGWLLSYVLDQAEGRSELEVLDARDLAAGPVAAVELPVRVPLGFHGCWFPDTA